ncbi:hypothetical protein SeLEV6574_g04923 [Synchytrium endobioticum]|uniref:TRP C-terminal domain-containing protein n=1 Tax=Synchytrium endobioticum TaxID=286115 RepID=A0A507CX21_9FUNG|nr:hypothetical protein SeLEV6574_g04923 [Synchytrium endobioticum]
MGALEIFQIVVNFAQHLSIITSFNISWPAQWTGILAVVRNMQLDLSVRFTQYVPAIDFRAQFIILTYLTPLLITSIMLIFFKTPQVVVWYGLLLGCLGALATGIALKFIPSTQFSVQTAISTDLMIAGGAGAGFLLLVALIVLFAKRQYKKRRRAKICAAADPTQAPTAADILNARSVSTVAMSNEIKPNLKLLASGSKYKIKPWWKILRNVIIAGTLLYGGLLLVGTTSNPYTDTYVSPVKAQAIGIAFGSILITFGSLLSYNVISGCFIAGRKLNKKMNSFFRKNMTQIALLAMVVLYIPQTTAIFNVFPCTFVTCSEGHEFVSNRFGLDAGSLSSSFLRNGANSTACTPCTFQSTCPAALASQLCPFTTDLRLNKDPSLSCISEMYPYYLPGALLLFFAATLGFPWLIHKLVSAVSQFLKDIPPLGATTQAESWLIHGCLSQNSCKALYYGYHYKWRFYNLNLVIQKFLVVAVYVFSVYHESAVAIVVACIHFAFFVSALYSRPYVNITEDVLSIACNALNALNAVISVLVAFQAPIPVNTIYAIATANIAVPVLTMLCGSYFERKLQRRIVGAHKSQLGTTAPPSKVQLAKERGRRVHFARHGPHDVTIRHRAPPLHDTTTSPMSREEGSYTVDPNSDSDSSDADPAAAPRHPAKTKPALTPEDKQLVELVKRLDAQLNVFLLRVLVQYFLVMGIAVFVAMCITGIGIIRLATDTTVVDSSSSYTNAAALAFELGGYATWSAFSSRCCCSPAPSTSRYANSSAALYEMWKCLPNADGAADAGNQLFYKMRKRYDAAIGSGLVLREYCATTFDTSVVCAEPALNSSGLVSVTLCPGVTLTSPQTADLW